MEKYQSLAEQDDKVRIEFTQDEALVLLDLLARWGDAKTDVVKLQHQAEYRVLWDLECILESGVNVVFSPDYPDHLARARLAVQDEP